MTFIAEWKEQRMYQNAQPHWDDAKFLRLYWDIWLFILCTVFFLFVFFCYSAICFDVAQHKCEQLTHPSLSSDHRASVHLSTANSAPLLIFQSFTFQCYYISWSLVTSQGKFAFVADYFIKMTGKERKNINPAKKRILSNSIHKNFLPPAAGAWQVVISGFIFFYCWTLACCGWKLHNKP